jgi:periplasmic protein TonB
MLKLAVAVLLLGTATAYAVEDLPAQGSLISPSWQNALVRHLQRYKNYPSGAKSRGEEGVVQLSFTVDRSGHVLNRKIVQSSGHPELDNEVMSMIERAQPLPPFPATMPQAKLDLTVPIRFSIQPASSSVNR